MHFGLAELTFILLILILLVIPFGLVIWWIFKRVRKHEDKA